VEQSVKCHPVLRLLLVPLAEYLTQLNSDSVHCRNQHVTFTLKRHLNQSGVPRFDRVGEPTRTRTTKIVNSQCKFSALCALNEGAKCAAASKATSTKAEATGRIE
jgi:hypothetical protein